MGHRLVTCLAAIAIPAASVWSAELPPMQLIPSQPPPAQSAGDRLVDRVIPAYGVRDAAPYRITSRMTELFQVVQGFTGHVDAMVLSNTLAIPDDQWVVPENAVYPSATRPVLVSAGLLPEQQHLLQLIAEVTRFEEATPLPNHYERWHINTSYRDLFRAGEHLALSLGDARFANLRDLHRAWKDYYHRLIQAEIVRRTAAIIDERQAELRRPNLDAALQLAIAEPVVIPWPAMSLDWENDPYAPVFLPAIPRWSEIDETVRDTFIARFGVPGQALTVGYPVSEEEVVPAAIEMPVADPLPDSDQDAALNPDGAAADQDGAAADQEAPADQETESLSTGGDDETTEAPEAIEPGEDLLDEPAGEETKPAGEEDSGTVSEEETDDSFNDADADSDDQSSRPAVPSSEVDLPPLEDW